MRPSEQRSRRGVLRAGGWPAWLMRVLQPSLAVPIIAALAIAFTAAGAQGREGVRPGVGEEDRRRIVASQEAPWSSLARIRTEQGVLCTGALISREAILTAAHCLLSPRTGALVEAAQVSVALGYERGDFQAHARGKVAIVAPGYEPKAGNAPSLDWALIILDRELPGRPLPFAASTPRGASVMLGGWQLDRAHVLQADTDCRVEAVLRDEAAGLLLRHDCAGTRGASGAPLLVQSKLGWAIAGVVIRASDRNRGGTAIASATVLVHARSGLQGRAAGTPPPAR